MDRPSPKPTRRAPIAKRTREGDGRERAPARALPTRRSGPAGHFREECEEAIAAIRKEVRALCDAVGVDPLKPQDISRRLKLNKNLTWKFARILVEEDALDAASMLPGPEGAAIYLKAFAEAGVAETGIDALRAAIDAFEEMVERHFGGRAGFELVLDGLRTGANLEQSRRLAFRGAAGVFGVQAAARVTAQIVAPRANETDQADVAMIVGLAGLRRLRPISKLPVFRSMVTSSSQLPPARPLIAGTPTDFLMREFSSFPHAGVSSMEKDGRLTIELDSGPIGRTGEADLFFGSVLERSYSLRATDNDSVARFVTSITIPSESFVSDIFVHRSIVGLDTLTASIHGILGGSVPLDEPSREATRIPIDCTPVVRDALPAAERASALEVASVPNYPAMIERAFAALGHDPAEFRLIRVAMAYPPMPASLVVCWDLPR